MNTGRKNGINVRCLLHILHGMEDACKSVQQLHNIGSMCVTAIPYSNLSALMETPCGGKSHTHMKCYSPVLYFQP